jgi:rfaE bifunctional protein nucleotidyltransferase chain/domain
VNLSVDLPDALAERRPRIVVLGDVMADSWTAGRCDRLCREAPAPVVEITAESFSPGGAGNTAANLAALGADTILVTALGDDETGQALIETLRSAGVSTDHVVAVAGRTTRTKHRITAGDQLMLRLDAGDNSPLPPKANDQLVGQLRQALRGCDALVVGDYGTGVLGPGVTEALKAIRAEIPLLVIDSHSPASWRELRPDVVTPNAAVAALSLAAACGVTLPDAVSLAQAAADVVVRRPGTSVCGRRELVERLGRLDGASEHSQLARIVAEHRTAGRRIVFTNGCFDVLHRGHVSYLDQAKQLGDVLIVAVNDDASVRRLKGPQRPVNTVADRAAVLAGLSCVDHVTQFSEDTPAALITLLKPDVYAKGGDYTPEMLPETPVVQSFGGEVHILGYVADHSTSAMIEKIRSA